MSPDTFKIPREGACLMLRLCRQGDLAELKIVGDPRAAERLCDDEDDSDTVSPSGGASVSVSV